MYNDYFGIVESPFSLAPDPSYLYLTEKHRTALAHLLYSARGVGGFTVLTGEVGTGKTTLCRAFLEQLPNTTASALILNPRLSESELLASICAELGLDESKPGASIKELIDALNNYLLQSYRHGRDTIVLIDEAQNLSPGVLEQIRLLTNLETSKRKLLQIVLVGQPELNDALARKDLRQLAQRITARYHLDALDRDETASLIRHRLKVAGLSEQTFDDAALAEIHRHAGGIPRLIVILAERCLLGAYSEGIRTVGRRLVRSAAREILVTPRRPRWRRAAAATLGLAAAGAVVAVASMSLMETTTWRSPTVPADWLGIARADSEPAAPAAGLEPVADSHRTEAAAVRAEPQPGGGPGVASARDTGTLQPPRNSAGIEVVELAAPIQLASGELAQARSLVTAAPSARDESSVPPNHAIPRTGTAVAAPWPDRNPAPAVAAGESSANAIALPDRVLQLTAADDESVYETLLGLWQQEYATLAGASPCEKARSAGLACLSRTGGWRELVQIDRPAVAFVRSQDGVSRAVLIARLETDRARVFVGDRSIWVGRQELAPLWDGDFIALWRPPFRSPRLLKAGYRGEAVLWLRGALGEAAGQAEDSAERFDESLRRAVLDFQRAAGLAVDGIVGPMTTIALINRMRGEGPIEGGVQPVLLASGW